MIYVLINPDLFFLDLEFRKKKMTNKKIDEEIFAKPRAVKFVSNRSKEQKQIESDLYFWQYQPHVHKKFYYNVKRDKEHIFKTMNGKRMNKHRILSEEEKWEISGFHEFKRKFDVSHPNHPYNSKVIQETIREIEEGISEDFMSESSTSTLSPSALPMPDPPLVILATMAELRQQGWNILTVPQFRDFLFSKNPSERFIQDDSPNIAHEAVIYSQADSEEIQQDLHEDVFDIQDPAIEQQINRQIIESPIPTNYSSFTPTNFFNDEMSSQSSRNTFDFTPSNDPNTSRSDTPIQNIFGTPMPEDL
jgi:hypothetical protein